MGGSAPVLKNFWGSLLHTTQIWGGRACRVKNWGGAAFSGRRPENWHRPPLGMFLGPSLKRQCLSDWVFILEYHNHIDIFFRNIRSVHQFVTIVQRCISFKRTNVGVHVSYLVQFDRFVVYKLVHVRLTIAGPSIGRQHHRLYMHDRARFNTILWTYSSKLYHWFKAYAKTKCIVPRWTYLVY